MTRQIEIYSLESVVLWLFGAIVIVAGVIDFVYMSVAEESPIRPLVIRITEGLDKIFQSFYQSAKLIPWVLAALLISVLAPIYDMHTDIGWADAVLRDGGDRVEGLSWAELLLNSHTRTLPTFIHVAQTAIVLVVLWVYSLLWNWVLRASGREGTISQSRGNRWQFIAGFVLVVVTPISYFLGYLGRHAELALRLPQIAG